MFHFDSINESTQDVPTKTNKKQYNFMSFQTVLIEITGGAEPLCSIGEVAHVMRKGEQTVYGYRNGNSQPSWTDAIALSEHLIREYGYYKLGMQALLVHAYMDSNPEQVVFEIIEAGIELKKAAKNQNETAYKNALGQLTASIETLKKAIS
jgi:hypothetical protein